MERSEKSNKEVADINVEIERRCWRYLDHTLRPDLERITKCVKLTGLDWTRLDWTGLRNQRARVRERLKQK